MTPTLMACLPSKQELQRAGSELAVSLAVELVVVGVVRRWRNRHRAVRASRTHEHPLLRAVVAEAAAEGATELSAQRRRLAWRLERRLEDEMLLARQHH